MIDVTFIIFRRIVNPLSYTLLPFQHSLIILPNYQEMDELVVGFI